QMSETSPNRLAPYSEQVQQLQAKHKRSAPISPRRAPSAPGFETKPAHPSQHSARHNSFFYLVNSIGETLDPQNGVEKSQTGPPRSGLGSYRVPVVARRGLGRSVPIREINEEGDWPIWFPITLSWVRP